MTIPRARKRQLMIKALHYAGHLVYCVPDTYEAFAELDDDEQVFMDNYIRSIGERMMYQADRKKAGKR